MHRQSRVAELPGVFLRETRVEGVKQLLVRKVSGARGQVGHGVGCSWDERELGAVSVVPLVKAGQAAHVGRRPGGGVAAFEHS